MSNPLIPARFLFRFSLVCRPAEPVWGKEGAGLDQRHRLPSLAELEGRAAFAEVRAAWSNRGLALSARVEGKTQQPWCRESRLADSDALQVWIDTRDVHNVHRASRFCHRFIFTPSGGGSRSEAPLARWLPINRAREQPRAIPDGSIQVRSEKLADGYLLEAFLAAESLTGFDPAEHPRLGFTYALVDRELGEQTLTTGRPMPYQEDPSLWATLELVG